MGGINTKNKDPPSGKYKFMYTEVRAIYHDAQKFTADRDAYFSLLKAEYVDGYRMITNYRLPMLQPLTQPKTVAQLGSNSKCLTCIFYYQPETKLQCDLRLITTTMTPNRTGLAEFDPSFRTDTSGIQQIIADNAETGGRLICVEFTGEQEKQRLGGTNKGVGTSVSVDLYFEISRNPPTTSDRYKYKCVPFPIQFNNINKQGKYVSTRFNHDWARTLRSHHAEGWKLVEICVDLGAWRQEISCGTLSSVWFLERHVPDSTLDIRPIYEGMVVEHQMCFIKDAIGIKSDTKLEAIVKRLGSNGWELACVVQTPTKPGDGLKLKLKVLMFFQRPVVLLGNGHPPPLGLTDVSPAYTAQKASDGSHAQHQNGSVQYSSQSVQHTKSLPVDVNQNSIPPQTDTMQFLRISGRSDGQQYSENGHEETKHHPAPSPDFKYPIFGPETVVYEATASRPTSQSDQPEHYASITGVTRERTSTSGSGQRYPVFGPETVEYAAARRETVFVESSYPGYYPRYRTYQRSLYGSIQNVQLGHGPQYSSELSRTIRRPMGLRTRQFRSTFSL